MRKKIETTKVVTDMAYWCDDCGKYVYKLNTCYKCRKDICKDCSHIYDSSGDYYIYICEDCKSVIDKYKEELEMLEQRECQIEALIDFECEQKLKEKSPCKYEQKQ